MLKVMIFEYKKQLVLHFSDDITAFNQEKSDVLAQKGKILNYFNAFIMQHLEKANIDTHFIDILADNESLVKHLRMIPVECVVRNVTAGSLCKRLGIAEGIELTAPLFEFFYKDDALGDPLVNEDHILSFGWATVDDIQAMRKLSLEVNAVLKPLFEKAGLILVDYKLEFGHYDGKVILGDEFTPDGCRIWDKQTKESLDKDRFRKDLGDILESYKTVAKRLNIPM